MGFFGKKTENAYFDKATRKFGKNKYSEAIKYYDKALEINPNHISSLVDKGVSLVSLGKHNESIIKMFDDKALKINPTTF